MFKKIRKCIAVIILIAFFSTSVKTPVLAQMAPDLMPHMPSVGVMVHLSPEFTPAILKGIVIHPENALKFDFVIYKGDSVLNDQQKKIEYTKLIKYFLASLAVPDDNQWVNLSPYEKDRIIKDDFGKTEMGRDLLAQDYLLKQITASLIYPQDKLGQKFWDKVYAKAQAQFGTTDIPVNTFNKVWIVPDDALVYEKGNMAYVVKNHLKVMLEEDYLSLAKHSGITSRNKTHTIASQVVREVVLPALEQEVNEGKNFAPLRQVFSGVVLAAWYKRELKESLLGKIYMDQSKVKGVDQNPKNNEIIYRQYLRAFKKGVFNFIKEDIDKYTNETVPRKYFSGGMKVAVYNGPKGVLKTEQNFTGQQEEQVAGELPDEALVTAVTEEKPDLAMTAINSQTLTSVLNSPLISMNAAKEVLTPQEIEKIYDPKNSHVKVLIVNGRAYKAVDVIVALDIMRKAVKDKTLGVKGVEIPVVSAGLKYADVYRVIIDDLTEELAAAVKAEIKSIGSVKGLTTEDQSPLKQWQTLNAVQNWVADKMNDVAEQNLNPQYQQVSFSNAPQTITLKAIQGEGILTLNKYSGRLNTESETIDGYTFPGQTKMVLKDGTHLNLQADDQLIIGQEFLVVYNKAGKTVKFYISPTGKGLILVDSRHLAQVVDFKRNNIKATYSVSGLLGDLNGTNEGYAQQSVNLDGNTVVLNGKQVIDKNIVNEQLSFDLRKLLEVIKEYSFVVKHAFNLVNILEEKTGEEEDQKWVEEVYESRWSDIKQTWPAHWEGTGSYHDVYSKVAHYTPIENEGQIRSEEFSSQVFKDSAMTSKDVPLASMNSKTLTSVLKSPPMSMTAAQEALPQGIEKIYDPKNSHINIMVVNGKPYKAIDVIVALDIMRKATLQAKGNEIPIVSTDLKYADIYAVIIDDLAKELADSEQLEIKTEGIVKGFSTANQGPFEQWQTLNAIQNWIADKMNEVSQQNLNPPYQQMSFSNAPQTITIKALQGEGKLTLNKFTGRLNTESENIEGYTFPGQTKMVLKDGTHLNLQADDELILGQEFLVVYNKKGKMVKFYVSPAGKGLVLINSNFLYEALTFMEGKVKGWTNANRLFRDLTAQAEGYDLQSVGLDGNTVVVKGKQKDDGKIVNEQHRIDMRKLLEVIKKYSLEIKHAFESVDIRREKTGEEENEKWVEEVFESRYSDDKQLWPAHWEGTGTFHDVYSDVPYYYPLENEGRVFDQEHPSQVFKDEAMNAGDEGWGPEWTSLEDIKELHPTPAAPTEKEIKAERDLHERISDLNDTLKGATPSTAGDWHFTPLDEIRDMHPIPAPLTSEEEKAEREFHQRIVDSNDNFRDQAITAQTQARRGGIDFNSANLNLQIKRDGKGIPLPISQQNLENIHIDGLVPVIINIQPAISSPLLSQLQLSGTTNQAKV